MPHPTADLDMGVEDSAVERRRLPRHRAQALVVSLRQRGRFGVHTVEAIDFNRFGLAVLVDKPLPKDQRVFVKICCPELRVDQLVGVVHNCRRCDSDGGPRYRCGIRFRTQSPEQFDRQYAERTLLALEGLVDELAAADDDSGTR